MTLGNADAAALRYGDLKVTDARGRVLRGPGWLLHGRELMLRADARGARSHYVWPPPDVFDANWYDDE